MEKGLHGPPWGTPGWWAPLSRLSLGRLTIVPFAGTHFPRERDGGCSGAPDNLKVLRAEATGLGAAGKTQSVKQEASRGSEAPHLHSLGPKPAHPQRETGPLPLSSQMGKKPISDKDKHRHTLSQIHTCMYTCIRIIGKTSMYL